MNNSESTYYEFLGITPDASEEQIKQAVRKKKRMTHPDTTGNSSPDEFIKAQEAEDVLLNPQIRAEYDAYIGLEAEAPADAPTEAPTNTGPTSNTTTTETQANSPEDEPFKFPTEQPRITPFEGRGVGIVLSRLVARVAHIGLILWLYVIAMLSLPSPRGFDAYLQDVANMLGLAVHFVLLFVLAFGPKMRVWITTGLVLLLVITSPSWINLETVVLIADFVTILLIRKLRNDSQRAAAESAVMMDMKTARDYNVFGEPGTGLATSNFSEENIQAGMKGEILTAEALRLLLDVPGVKVFHGLQFGGHTDADVDHAVVYGNRVALIDSKLWPADSYNFVTSAAIQQSNGGLRPVHMSQAVRNYAQYLGHRAQVAGWILIHPATDSRPLVTDNSHAPATLRMGAKNQVLAEVAVHLFYKSPAIIDRVLLGLMANAMK